MTQHATLTPERWAAFNLDQQILMIGNEMNRATRLLSRDERPSLALAYERVLRLTDLTVEVQTQPSLRRELLRCRDLIAELYLQPDSESHAAAFRVLLLFTPMAAQQIPHVLGGATM